METVIIGRLIYWSCVIATLVVLYKTKKLSFDFATIFIVFISPITLLTIGLAWVFSRGGKPEHYNRVIGELSFTISMILAVIVLMVFTSGAK